MYSVTRYHCLAFFICSHPLTQMNLTLPSFSLCRSRKLKQRIQEIKLGSVKSPTHDSPPLPCSSHSPFTLPSYDTLFGLSCRHGIQTVCFQHATCYCSANRRCNIDACVPLLAHLSSLLAQESQAEAAHSGDQAWWHQVPFSSRPQEPTPTGTQNGRG